MLFSEKFNVPETKIKEYGAMDISLCADLPLFIDPLLIFNSNKIEYKLLHEKIIKYFHFLAEKAKKGLTDQEIKTWFSFNEVKQNWLGYSISGNQGLAFGMRFARFLSENISFSLSTHGISKSEHVEKVLLLYDGAGRDKISDLTVNLIKDFLLQYTEIFAKKYINSEYLHEFTIDKVDFNYDTESFMSKKYKLPFIINSKGKKEFVILTPIDILRHSEPAINQKDMLESYDQILDEIDNWDLKTQVWNYIAKAINEYENKQKKNKKKISEKQIEKIKKDCLKELLLKKTELYDYYVKYKEKDPILIQNARKETTAIYHDFIVRISNILNNITFPSYIIKEKKSAFEEAKERVKFFKHAIEYQDLYKIFYRDNERIFNERELQLLFKLTWVRTNFCIDAETKNGRGISDFIVSYGEKDKCIVEFKMAKSSTFEKVFGQIESYKKTNRCTNGIIVVFYFSNLEYEKAMQVIKERNKEKDIDNTIFLIDCIKENKISASKIN